MNWWLVTAGVTALICAAGHAFAGRNMFYLPMKAAIKDSLHAGVLTGMWHLITINFTLSAVALLMLGAIGGPENARKPKSTGQASALDSRC